MVSKSSKRALKQEALKQEALQQESLKQEPTCIGLAPGCALKTIFSNAGLLILKRTDNINKKNRGTRTPNSKEASQICDVDVQTKVKSIIKSYLAVGLLGLVTASWACLKAGQRYEVLANAFQDERSSSKWPLAKRDDMEREKEEQLELLKMMDVMIPFYVYLLMLNTALWFGVTKPRDRLTFVGFCMILIQIAVELGCLISFGGIQYYLPAYLQIASTVISATEGFFVATFLLRRIEQLKGIGAKGKGPAKPVDSDKSTSELQTKTPRNKNKKAAKSPEPEDEDIFLSESTIEYQNRSDVIKGAGDGDTPRPTCGRRLIENHTRKE